MSKLIAPSGSLSYPVFKEEVKRVERDMRMAIFEWARLNPVGRIPPMLDLINECSEFLKSYNGYFESLRLMYYYTIDEEVELKSNAYEKIQDRRLEDRIAEETRKLNDLKDKYDRQSELVKNLVAHRNPLPFQNRNAWQEYPSVKVKQIVVVPFRPNNLAPNAQVDQKQNVGRPHKIQAFEHRRPSDVDEDLYRKRPYMSRVRGHQYNGPVWDVGCEPIPSRESDENLSGALASRKTNKRFKSSFPSGLAGKPMARMTQDQIEEDDAYHQDNFINC